MTGTGEKASWKQAPGWMKALLVVSLLGNAAVAGMVGGNFMHDKRGPSEPGLSRQQARILQMVPEARRGVAREILIARSGDADAAREAMRAAQQEIVAAIRAEPFSADRLMAAMAARQAAGSTVWESSYSQLAEIAGKLTAAERSQMADAMDERYKRWTERRDGKR